MSHTEDPNVAHAKMMLKDIDGIMELLRHIRDAEVLEDCDEWECSEDPSLPCSLMHRLDDACNRAHYLQLKSADVVDANYAIGSLKKAIHAIQDQIEYIEKGRRFGVLE